MEWLSIAVRAAREAGNIISKDYHRKVSVSTKSGDPRNLVTDTDLKAEARILQILSREFPEHGILSEESHPDTEFNSRRYVWIIDPLDGTTNFSRGIPDVSVSIALSQRNEPILGVVYQPFTGELFWAVKRKGAFLDQTRIRVSEVAVLGKSLITQSFAYSNEFRKEPLRNINRLFFRVQGIRLYHSTALELSYLACGRVDACIVSGSNPWDVAAGALIVQEAGGTITATDGTPWHFPEGRFLASNGRFHSALVNALTAEGPEETPSASRE